MGEHYVAYEKKKTAMWYGCILSA